MVYGYDIATISNIIAGQIVGKQSSSAITNIFIDSRKIVEPEGSLFFALVGEQHDGHQYVTSLVKRGFTCFVVSRELDLPDHCCQIIVENATKGLQLLAGYHRAKFNIPVVGITGSNGKTIVKEWLFQLLQTDKYIVRSPKSYNSQIGVPLSLWKLEKVHELAFFEAGISELGEMDLLEQMIKPSDVIVTNILGAHDENFENRQVKANEKIRLAKNASCVFYCLDYPELKGAFSGMLIKQNTWSKKEKKCTLYIKSVIKGEGFTDIVGEYKQQIISVTIPFNDDASIENAIHCWLYLLENNFPNVVIAERMRLLSPVSMRLEFKQGTNNNTIINDSYNSDINSLGIAIDLLNQQQQHSKKVLILSDIYESGKIPKDLYQEVNTLLKAKKVDFLIGVGRQIFEAKKYLSGVEAQFYESTEDTIKALVNMQLSDCAILVKGSRKFHFEKVSKALEFKSHKTVLEINLSSIQQNLNYYRSLLQPETKVMVMVKAFSYGSGTHEIANLMQFNNVDYLGVAYADEGVALRKAGITLPIMVMNPEKEAFQEIIKYQLEPEIYSLSLFQEFCESLRSSLMVDGKIFPIHIKVDTGMHRLGFLPEEITELIRQIKLDKLVKVQSVFSHLVGSGRNELDSFTNQQMNSLDDVYRKISDSFDYKIDRHILNSGGIERFPDAQYEMVRLGIGLHGIAVLPKTQRKLAQVATLKSSISQIKEVKKGETVGYNRSGIASKDLKIATVAIGYADGYSRRLGNGVGKMIVNGKKVRTIGDICMDMCMLDVTNISCQVGDRAIVFGDANYTLDEMANDLETIPYEILTGISQRVKRVYYQD